MNYFWDSMEPSMLVDISEVKVSIVYAVPFASSLQLRIPNLISLLFDVGSVSNTHRAEDLSKCTQVDWV